MIKSETLYDQWNMKKKSIEFVDHSSVVATPGTLRWYYDGVNIGSELSKDGKFMRLGVIVAQYVGGSPLVVIMPCTTQRNQKKKNTLIEINNVEKYGIKQTYVIINQVKHLDRKRLIKKASNSFLSVGFVKILLNTYCGLLQKNLL